MKYCYECIQWRCSRSTFLFSGFSTCTCVNVHHKITLVSSKCQSWPHVWCRTTAALYFFKVLKIPSLYFCLLSSNLLYKWLCARVSVCLQLLFLQFYESFFSNLLEIFFLFVKKWTVHLSTSYTCKKSISDVIFDHYQVSLRAIWIQSSVWSSSFFPSEFIMMYKIRRLESLWKYICIITDNLRQPFYKQSLMLQMLSGLPLSCSPLWMICLACPDRYGFIISWSKSWAMVSAWYLSGARRRLPTTQPNVSKQWSRWLMPVDSKYLDIISKPVWVTLMWLWLRNSNSGSLRPCWTSLFFRPVLRTAMLIRAELELTAAAV